MKKAACLFFIFFVFTKSQAQYKITCGSQAFNIKAQKLSTIKQIDPVTKVVTSYTYYYFIEDDKLQIWLQIADSITRSFTLYEIEKKAIDQNLSGEIAEYDQQEYTQPVKTLYIKCAAGKKDVAVSGYVDWAEKPDTFSWFFININSYSKTELENLWKEINNWLKQ